MGWLKFIPDVLGLIASPLKGWVERKKMKQEHGQLIESARVNATIRRLDKDQQADIGWDIQNTKNAQTSWKDEFWTIVLSIPLVMCFIPGTVEYVRKGFEVLAETPEWYRYAVLTAIAAAFGMRQLAKLKGDK